MHDSGVLELHKHDVLGGDRLNLFPGLASSVSFQAKGGVRRGAQGLED